MKLFYYSVKLKLFRYTFLNNIFNVSSLFCNTQFYTCRKHTVMFINDSNLRDQICPGTQATHFSCSFLRLVSFTYMKFLTPSERSARCQSKCLI